MATRAGSVDPGLVLWLLRHGLDADALEQGLDREGGVRGLAGDADMRAVLARDDDDARLAIDVYVHRLRAGIAAMAAALGGLDALVFTGGVGEHAPQVRARTAGGLGFLGVELDPGPTRGPPLTRRSARAARRRVRSSSPRARTSRSRARCGTCSAQPEPDVLADALDELAPPARLTPSVRSRRASRRRRGHRPRPRALPGRPLARGPDAVRAHDRARARAAGGRVFWNVNSTAHGGGVAEMLRSLIGYARGVGIDARWVTIGGDADFFRVTKRLHNRLHGSPATAGRWAPPSAPSTSASPPSTPTCSRSASGPADVVLLHDPQTAGMVAPLRRERRARHLARAHRPRRAQRPRARGVALSHRLRGARPTPTSSRAPPTPGRASTRPRSPSSRRRSTRSRPRTTRCPSPR